MFGRSLVIFTLIYLSNFIESLDNGQFVRVSQFPYVVSVRYNDIHMCGGVIIDESTVLTAAHCVQINSQKSRFSVRLGTTFHDEGQKLKVKDIIQHKNFNKTVKNDFNIAVLKLSSKINFDSNIKPIQLKKNNKLSSETKCYIAGWGDEKTALGLNSLSVNIIDNNECSDYLSVTPNMICARSTKCYADRSGSIFNQEVAQGDTGGPLICDHKLVGVISFGCVECVQPFRPGVYTRISAVYEWIHEKKKNSVWPQCSSRGFH